MGNISQLKKQLKVIGEEIEHRLNVQSEIQQQIADLTCPYKIGDKVFNKYSETKAVVHSIEYSSLFGYKFYIKKIKKNGDPFLFHSEAWDHDDWAKCND